MATREQPRARAAAAELAPVVSRKKRALSLTISPILPRSSGGFNLCQTKNIIRELAVKLLVSCCIANAKGIEKGAKGQGSWVGCSAG